MAKELSFSERNKICQASFYDISFLAFEDEVFIEEDYQCPSEAELLERVFESLKKLDYSSIRIVKDIKKCNCIVQITIKKDLTTIFTCFDFCNVRFCTNFNGRWMYAIGEKQFKETSFTKNLFSVYLPNSKNMPEQFDFFGKPKNFFLAIE